MGESSERRQTTLASIQNLKAGWVKEDLSNPYQDGKWIWQHHTMPQTHTQTSCHTHHTHTIITTIIKKNVCMCMYIHMYTGQIYTWFYPPSNTVAVVVVEGKDITIAATPITGPALTVFCQSSMSNVTLQAAITPNTLHQYNLSTPSLHPFTTVLFSK